MKKNTVLKQRSSPTITDESGFDRINILKLKMDVPHLPTTSLSFIFSCINMILSIYCIITYIIATYCSVYQTPQGFNPHIVFTMSFICRLYFLAQFIVRLLWSQVVSQTLLSKASFIDMVTLIPYFIGKIISGEFIPGNFKFNIFRYIGEGVCMLRILIFQKLGHFLQMTEINRQIYEVVVQLLTAIAVPAFILQLALTQTLIQNQLIQKKLIDMSFLGFFYFVVTTISTQGLFCFISVTVWMKILILITILTSIYFLQLKISLIIQLVTSKSQYQRNNYISVKNTPHIILIGHLTKNSLEAFFQEFFHQDHGTQPKHAVILDSSHPSLAVQNLLAKYPNKIFYIQGDPLEVISLKRCRVEMAGAIVILSVKNCGQYSDYDARTVLQAMILKHYLRQFKTTPRFCMQILGRQSKLHYNLTMSNRNSKDQVICLSEIKMSMFARSCMCPGVISLLLNLIMTSQQSDKKHSFQWIKHYTRGQSYEIYKMNITDMAVGQTFAELFLQIYRQFSCLLFSIEVVTEGRKKMYINVPSLTLRRNNQMSYHGYFIAEDADQVKRIIQIYKQKVSQLGHKDILDESQEKKNLQQDNKQAAFDFLNDDINIFSKCHRTRQKVNFKYINFKTLRNNILAYDHILLCGSSQHLISFVYPLRSLAEKSYKPIIILNQEEPSEKDWNQLSYFPLIYFIKGSALSSDDLLRANLLEASKVVVLAPQGSHSYPHKNRKQSWNLTKDEFDLMDAKTIFKYRQIRKLRPDIPIFTELILPENMLFLVQNEKDYKLMLDHGFSSVPMFASGQIYLSSMMDRLLCQSLYNNAIVQVINHILVGFQDHNSKLNQLPIPKAIIGKSFEYVVQFMMQRHGILVIAVYRLPGSSDNLHPYVWTNPDPNLKTAEFDQLIVFSKCSKRLQGMLIGPNQQKEIVTRQDEQKKSSSNNEPDFSNSDKSQQHRKIIKKLQDIHRKLVQIEYLAEQVDLKIDQRQNIILKSLKDKLQENNKNQTIINRKINK